MNTLNLHNRNSLVITFLLLIQSFSGRTQNNFPAIMPQERPAQTSSAVALLYDDWNI